MTLLFTSPRQALRQRRRLAVAAFAVSVLGVLAGDASAAAKSRTIAELPQRVAAFAYAQGRIAWVPQGRCTPVFATARTVRSVHVARRACEGEAGLLGMAFDGRRALWDEWNGSNDGSYHTYFTASAAGGPVRAVGQASSYNWPAAPNGGIRGGAALAGTRDGLLFYEFCEYDCERASNGGVRRLRGSRAIPLSPGPGELRLAAVAVARGLYATARTEITHRGCGCVLRLSPTDGLDPPLWSPDGKSILYTAAVGRDTRTKRLFLVPADGSAPARRLTSALADEREPSWSPDGSTVVYSARDVDPKQPRHLFAVPVDGDSQPRRLSSVDASESAPGWSPDGRFIAAARGGQGIVVIDVATGSERPIAPGWRARWSPDGSRLAIIDGPEVRVVDASTGAVRSRVSLAAHTSLLWSLDWSPDGRRLAVGGGGLFLIDAATAKATVLDEGALDWESVEWSADGTQLLVASNEGYGSDLAIIPADGGHGRGRAVGADVKVFGISNTGGAWSPDGSQIALGSDARDPEWGLELAVAASATGRVVRWLTGRPRLLTAVAERRRLRDGKLVQTIRVPNAVARNVVVSGTTFGLVTEVGRGRRLELAAVATGRRLGSVTLTPGAAQFHATDRTIVFAARRRLYALDASTRRTRPLTTTNTAAIGLSLEGRLLVWAENRGRGAVVRTLELR